MKLIHLRRGLAFAGALTSLAAAGAARADVTSPAYDASKCRPVWYDQVDRWETNDAEQSIKNKSAIKSTVGLPQQRVLSELGRPAGGRLPPGYRVPYAQSSVAFESVVTSLVTWARGPGKSLPWKRTTPI